MGPGLLLKGTWPRGVSIIAFGATQVAVDCEPLYRHFRHESRLHGPIHSVLVGGAVGLATGALVWILGRRWAGRLPAALRRDLDADSALLGGWIGGVSHALLDALVHHDVQPLWPFAHTDWVLPPAGIAAVPVACVIAGIAGALLWAARRDRA